MDGKHFIPSMSNLRNGSLLKHASLGWSSSYTFLESALTLPRPLFISVSGAKANWRSGRLCLLSEGDSLTLRNAGLRFGSKADVCGATSHIRFTPNSDIDRVFPQTVVSALPPKADMGSAKAHVCFGPIADILADPNINGHPTRRVPLADGSTGRMIWKMAPFLPSDFAVSRPPCCSIILVHIANPNPVPPDLVVTNASKMSLKRSGLIPSPESSTSMTIALAPSVLVLSFSVR